jgi:hypothetical protein
MEFTLESHDWRFRRQRRGGRGDGESRRGVNGASLSVVARLAAGLERALGDFGAVLLEIHDGIRNLDVDRIHHLLDVERTFEAVAQEEEEVNVLVPSHIDFRMRRQASLHHVQTEFIARLQERQALTMRAVDHLHQRLVAFARRRHFRDFVDDVSAHGQGLDERARRHERTPDLQGQALCRRRRRQDQAEV